MLFPGPQAVAHVGWHVLDGSYEGHRHEFVEIAFVSAGVGTHASDGGERALRRGDVVLLLPGAWHAYLRCDSLAVVNCCIPAQALRCELAWLRTDPSVARILWQQGGSGSVRKSRVSGQALDNLHALLGEVERAANQEEGPARAEAIGLVTVLLARLAPTLNDSTDAASTAAPPLVLAGIRMLEDAPGHRWRLSELAGSLHVDASYLTRLFTAHVGAPPMTYLARCRAETAAAWLQQTDKQVSTIGARVGWPDPNYFARRFRQHFGESPSAYRNHALYHGAPPHFTE